MIRRSVACVVCCCCLPAVADAQRVCAVGTVPPVAGLAYTPDSKTLISCGSDAVVSFRDGISAEVRLRLPTEQGTVFAMAPAPDGKRLATAGADRSVRIWSVPDGKSLLVFRGHTEIAETVAFTADGKMAASSGTDGIRLWNAEDGKELKFIPFAEARITGLAFAPNGKTLATAGVGMSGGAAIPIVDSDSVRLWDVATGKQTARLPIKGHAVAFSADGRYLVAGGYGVYQARPGEGANLVINMMAFRPMNRVALWDVKAHKEAAAVENMGNAFALSRDGRFFAVGRGSEHCLNRFQGGGIRLGVADNSQAVGVREILTGQVVQSVPSPAGATALALSPDGARLAAAGADGNVKVWELAPKSDHRVLQAADLERCWSHLLAPEAAPAFAAVWSLAGTPEQSVPFLKSHLSPVKWDRTMTKKWIDNLDSDDFDTRTTAAIELRRLAPRSNRSLRARLQGDISAETRRAVNELLEALAGRAALPEELRSLRAIQALERAATPAARAVLKTLAGGEPEARLTLEAKQALERMETR